MYNSLLLTGIFHWYKCKKNMINFIILLINKPYICFLFYFIFILFLNIKKNKHVFRCFALKNIHNLFINLFLFI